MYALVELARAALARTHDAHPPAGADHLRGEVELVWRRRPWSAGLAGDIAARTGLVNFVCGSKILDPAGREVGCAALSLLRGETTRFRALRDDGTIEEHALPSEVDGVDALARRERAEGARRELADRELALDRVQRSLPRLLRRRPRRWELWLWPIWWLLSRLNRRGQVERRFAELAAQQSQSQLESAERDQRDAEERVRVVRTRYFESLRSLGSARGVRELAITLANGPLPEGIELRELTGAATGLDAVLVIERDAMYAPRAGDSTPVRIGEIAETIASLPELLPAARAWQLATRARDLIGDVLAGAEDVLDRAEGGFEVRLSRLAAMQLADPAGFMQAELARVRPQIVTSVHAVIEHASAHLGGELARLAEDWIGAIASATTGDELKETISRLETTSTATVQRIHGEVQLLVMGGAGGVAHDLYPEVTSGLRARGLVESPPREAPELPTFELLPALASPSAAKLTGAVQWLTGLFRSFDARRAEVREKAYARVDHLRDVAFAELLDVEPKLHAAIGDVLAAYLAGATTRQLEWHASTSDIERAAIAAERESLAPLARLRRITRRDVELLTEQIEVLEKQAPAIVAAAAAASVR